MLRGLGSIRGVFAGRCLIDSREVLPVAARMDYPALLILRLLMSTKRLKCSRKSVPRIGKSTSATNSQWTGNVYHSCG